MPFSGSMYQKVSIAELVQAGRLAAGVDRPDVEPAGVLDGAFGVLGDQRLVARQVVDRALGADEYLWRLTAAAIAGRAFVSSQSVKCSGG